VIGDSYPTDGLTLPQVEGHTWSLSDRGQAGRKSVSVWLVNQYGSFITCDYARPSQHSIEATALKVYENWRTYLHLKERVNLPQVRDEKWELDATGVGRGYVRVELGDLLSHRGRESDYANLNYASIERVARRLAKRRERYHRFIEQDFNLPALPDGQQWQIDFKGGPLPYVTVNIRGSYRTSKIAHFTRHSVRKVARSFPGADARNTAFFQKLASR
jgi:hypothetical protein